MAYAMAGADWRGNVMTDTIHYGQLMHQAMRGLLVHVLRQVAENGLPGEHHFFITFETHADGVDIPDWLKERYPEDMTIVLQEWFDNLVVTEEDFTVTLNFGDQEVTMLIPFDAIRTFVDPSVEFGLRFEATEEEDDSDPAADAHDGAHDHEHGANDDGPEDGKDAEIVSLDSFRK